MTGWSFSLSCVLTRPKQDLLLLSWEGAPGWGKEAPESCSMGAEPAWTSDGGMEEETEGVGEERMKRRRGGKAWVTTKSKWLTTCGSKWKWRGGGQKERQTNATQGVPTVNIYDHQGATTWKLKTHYCCDSPLMLRSPPAASHLNFVCLFSLLCLERLI